MPIFEIQGADGQIYEVDAPDQNSAVQAFTQFQPPTITPQATQPVQGGYSDAPDWTKPITSFGTGIVDAATFGFKDEIGAGVSTLGSMVLPWRDETTYEQELAKIRQDEKALAEQAPISNIAGQVTGGVGMGLGLGKIGALPSANLSPAASLAARVGTGAAEGAAMGGLYGVGSGEGTADRVAEGVFGGLTGGAIGGLVPAVSAGVSSAYRNIADRAAKAKVAADAGVSPEVARLLTNVTDADATLGPAGMSNMARAGNEAMLADAGPNAQAVLDTAIQRGGPGAVLARQRIEGRVGRDAAAMTGALDNTLGTPEGILASQQSIRQASRPGVNAAYELAENTPINYATPEGMMVEDVITRIPNRFKSQAIQRANERLAYEGKPNLQIMADIAEDGAVTFREMPNVMQADAIKKALDDVVRDNTDAVTGKMSAEGAFASRIARDLRDAVSSAVPEYSQALKTAADPLQRVAATEAGGSLLSDRVTRDQAEMMIERMSGAEKKAARQGVRSFIDDQMARVKTAFTDPNMDAREAASAIKNLSSRANREKLTTLLGDAEAKTLFDELDRVSQSFGLKASVAQNSKTFARQATAEGINDITSPGVVGTLAEGEPLNATKRVIQALTGRTPEAIKGRQDAVYSEVADFLTRDASSAIPAFRAMQNFGGKIAANDLRAMEIARLLSQGRNAVYPATVMANE